MNWFIKLAQSGLLDQLKNAMTVYLDQNAEHGRFLDITNYNRDHEYNQLVQPVASLISNTLYEQIWAKIEEYLQKPYRPRPAGFESLRPSSEEDLEWNSTSPDWSLKFKIDEFEIDIRFVRLSNYSVEPDIRTMCSVRIWNPISQWNSRSFDANNTNNAQTIIRQLTDRTLHAIIWRLFMTVHGRSMYDLFIQIIKPFAETSIDGGYILGAPLNYYGPEPERRELGSDNPYLENRKSPRELWDLIAAYGLNNHNTWGSDWSGNYNSHRDDSLFIRLPESGNINIKYAATETMLLLQMASEYLHRYVIQ